ncbi:MAG: hypothetical protein GYB68_07970, partial [Chloroflexi bacterium]|nr:hypothetical protein [Chloroflexota bacterium]
MFRTLQFRLTIAFVITSVIGVILVALLVRGLTVRVFNIISLEERQADFAEEVLQIYERNSRLEDVAVLF